MPRSARADDRDEILTDVAEMYYEEGLTQAEIAAKIGVTRSAISRMLTDARERGIVEIKVRRPLRFDEQLEAELTRQFGLEAAHVLVWNKKDRYEELRDRLGKAASHVLTEMLAHGMVVGLPWGTTIAATIEAVKVESPVGVRVVQLVGVLGSSSHAYNGQALVERLAYKLGGEGIYLYTPFIVESSDTVRSLLANPEIRTAIDIGRQSNIALLGIGTTASDHSSLYLGGHITRDDLERLELAGAVGDISGYHFDIQGRMLDIAFNDCLVGIARDDLLGIPTRLAVAGGAPKVISVLGALRGGLVNVLVTDSTTATEILDLDAAG
jgi:DNA-binding transcriptional regulator LsrR (DeoR family)